MDPVESRPENVAPLFRLHNVLLRCTNALMDIAQAPVWNVLEDNTCLETEEPSKTIRIMVRVVVRLVNSSAGTVLVSIT